MEHKLLLEWEEWVEVDDEVEDEEEVEYFKLVMSIFKFSHLCVDVLEIIRVVDVQILIQLVDDRVFT